MNILRRIPGALMRRLSRLAGRAVPSTLVPPLPPTAHRDYQRAWVDLAGKSYRMTVYERQRAQGSKPLIDNPRPEEIAVALRADGARRVLEVGCGWGRLMTALSGEFAIEGCDVSEDMLRLCPPELRAFHYDVAVEDLAFLRQHIGAWDAVFTRGVMLYLATDPGRTCYAINNMLALSRGNVHCWEWPEVCDLMHAACASPRLVLHPIAHRSE